MGEGTGRSGSAAGCSGPAGGPAGEPPGEPGGCGGGEDDEPLGMCEAGHGRGAAGPFPATNTPVQQRAAACAPPEARGFFVSMKARL